jgi:hypothetical protein
MAQIGPYAHLPVEAYFEHAADGVNMRPPVDVGTVFLVDNPVAERRFVLEVTNPPSRELPQGMLSIMQAGAVQESRMPDFTIAVSEFTTQTASGVQGHRVELAQKNTTGSITYTVPVGVVRAIMSPQLALAVKREHQREQRESLVKSDQVQAALPYLEQYFALLVEHGVNPDAIEELEAVKIQLKHLGSIADHH